MTNHTATASARTAAAVAASPPPPPGLSLFERLPAELRLQIYDLLFASEDVPAQPQQPMHNHQDPTYQAPSHEGPAHAKHTNTAAAVLSLNKRINADATPALYARPVFELKVRPTGIMLCGGRSLSLSLPLAQNHSSPQHQNPSQAKDSSQAKGSSQAQSPFLPLLAHARNLNIHIIAFLQPSMYARTLAHLHALTRALRTHNAPLRSLRFAIDWHNGSLAFPVRQPDFAMVRGLVGALVGEGGGGGDGGMLCKGLRELRWGRLEPPRFSAFGGVVGGGAGAGEGEDEEEEYVKLREEVAARLLAIS